MLCLPFPVAAALLAVAVISLSGCSDPKTGSLPKDPPPLAGGAHEHPSEGPHEGHLIELGNEEYHAELLHDDKTHTVTIYILDSTAKKETPIGVDAVILNLVVDGSPQQFSMEAVGAAEGLASQFQLVNESVLEALEHGEETKGRLNVTIDGKPYVGKIDHHAHDEHDHAHEGHAH
ncbi:hypothetical protein [Lignipirellula cremea]|uniref:Uncharacterized protein n=1 Tax=Lignipirellula cremea TaxID=2528010 RepID=A0A518E3M2_9BACT|nr:hypothetical protein [Lignipirellula cremea]QDU98687.1 hypothetical protein Pla8534_65600 [Lignipirellula cremea]